MHMPALFQFTDNERLKQFKRHFLRKSTLLQLEVRPDHNDGTPRIIHALPQQILPEATLLSFQHITQRFERTISRSENGPSVATVVKKSVHGFLQHPLFVANNDVG